MKTFGKISLNSFSNLDPHQHYTVPSNLKPDISAGVSRLVFIIYPAVKSYPRFELFPMYSEWWPLMMLISYKTMLHKKSSFPGLSQIVPLKNHLLVWYIESPPILAHGNNARQTHSGGPSRLWMCYRAVAFCRTRKKDGSILTVISNAFWWRKEWNSRKHRIKDRFCSYTCCFYCY